MRTQASIQAATFAAELIGRYARSAAQRRALELLLPNAAVLVTAIVNDCRLALCVSTPRSRGAAYAERRAGPQAWRQLDRSLHTLPPLQRPLAARTFVQETTLTRIAQRLQRIETRASDGASMTALASRAESSMPQLQRAAEQRQSAVPPAEEMPLRQRVVAAHAPLAHQSGAESTSAARSSAHVPAKVAGGSVSEHELERLADRVISSIDRRIVAQRERFGRP
jgi:hypothetical protein